MKRKRSGAMVERLGPVGLSLVAAAITAAGFAAISVAANGDNDEGDGDRSKEPGLHVAIGPPGPLGENLSEEDRQKLEDFRNCLEDQGVEAPGRPMFDRFDPESAPDPPSRSEMEAMRKEMNQAHEACKDELPEDLQDVPGPIGGVHCEAGPPPARKERGENQGDNESQGFVLPAPAPSGTS
jgi:hypothetical protein